MSVRDRITKEQKEALYSRKRSVTAIAAELGVTVSHLSKYCPEREPKRNARLLLVTRKLFQKTIATECLNGKYSVAEAAKLAYVSLRTMYRRVEELKNEHS